MMDQRSARQFYRDLGKWSGLAPGRQRQRRALAQARFRLSGGHQRRRVRQLQSFGQGHYGKVQSQASAVRPQLPRCPQVSVARL